MSLKEICRCGCDKASHYRESNRGPYLACLVRGCDDCRAYVDRNAPQPKEPDTIPIVRAAQPWQPQPGDRIAVALHCYWEWLRGKEGYVVSINDADESASVLLDGVGFECTIQWDEMVPA